MGKKKVGALGWSLITLIIISGVTLALQQAGMFSIVIEGYDVVDDFEGGISFSEPNTGIEVIDPHPDSSAADRGEVLVKAVTDTFNARTTTSRGTAGEVQGKFSTLVRNGRLYSATDGYNPLSPTAGDRVWSLSMPSEIGASYQGDGKILGVASCNVCDESGKGRRTCEAPMVGGVELGVKIAETLGSPGRCLPGNLGGDLSPLSRVSIGYDARVISSNLNPDNKVVVVNGQEIKSITTTNWGITYNNPSNEGYIDWVGVKPVLECVVNDDEIVFQQTFAGEQEIDVFSLQFGAIIKAGRGKFCTDLPAQIQRPGFAGSDTEIYEKLLIGETQTIRSGEIFVLQGVVNKDSTGISGIDKCNIVQEYWDVDIGDCQPKPGFVTVATDSFIDTERGWVITQETESCDGFWLIENGEAVCKSVPEINQQCTSLTLDRESGECDLYLSPESLLGSVDFDQQSCPEGYDSKVIGVQPYRMLQCSKTITSEVIEEAKEASIESGKVKCGSGKIINPENPTQCITPAAYTNEGQQTINTKVNKIKQDDVKEVEIDGVKEYVALPETEKKVNMVRVGIILAITLLLALITYFIMRKRR